MIFNLNAIDYNWNMVFKEENYYEKHAEKISIKIQNLLSFKFSYQISKIDVLYPIIYASAPHYTYQRHIADPKIGNQYLPAVIYIRCLKKSINPNSLPN